MLWACGFHRPTSDVRWYVSIPYSSCNRSCRSKIGRDADRRPAGTPPAAADRAGVVPRSVLAPPAKNSVTATPLELPGRSIEMVAPGRRATKPVSARSDAGAAHRGPDVVERRRDAVTQQDDGHDHAESYQANENRVLRQILSLLVRQQPPNLVLHRVSPVRYPVRFSTENARGCGRGRPRAVTRESGAPSPANRCSCRKSRYRTVVAAISRLLEAWDGRDVLHPAHTGRVGPTTRSNPALKARSRTHPAVARPPAGRHRRAYRRGRWPHSPELLRRGPSMQRRRARAAAIPRDRGGPATSWSRAPLPGQTTAGPRCPREPRGARRDRVRGPHRARGRRLAPGRRDAGGRVRRAGGWHLRAAARSGHADPGTSALPVPPARSRASWPTGPTRSIGSR